MRVDFKGEVVGPKAPNVLRGMGLMHLAKNEKAKKELAEKGMTVE